MVIQLMHELDKRCCLPHFDPNQSLVHLHLKSEGIQARVNNDLYMVEQGQNDSLIPKKFQKLVTPSL
jgi:hypothetical protein